MPLKTAVRNAMEGEGATRIKTPNASCPRPAAPMSNPSTPTSPCAPDAARCTAPAAIDRIAALTDLRCNKPEVTTLTTQ